VKCVLLRILGRIFPLNLAIRTLHILRKMRTVTHFRTFFLPWRLVSATELARNARAILERVASGGETVMVERNGRVVARIARARRDRGPGGRPTPAS